VSFGLHVTSSGPSKTTPSPAAPSSARSSTRPPSTSATGRKDYATAWTAFAGRQQGDGTAHPTPPDATPSFPDSVDDLTDEHLWAALDAHLPESAPIDRDQLLERAAATLGHDLTRGLRSRLNKHIRRQIEDNQLQQINNWAQIRRA